ncbi:MAG: PAS domain-containing protein [Comamonas sp.]
MGAWRQGLHAMAGWLPGGAQPRNPGAPVRDLLGLALVGTLGALLAVQGVTLWRLDDRAKERERILDDTRQALLAQTLHSATLAGAVAIGLGDAAIKDLARGLDVPPEETQMHFARLRMRLPVLSVHVLDREGRSMAQDASERASPGRVRAFEPYFRQALQGQPSVFAALEAGNRTRNLFHVAPVHATAQADSEVLGVVVLKTDAAALDAVLQRNGLITLLLDPHGVAFSATRPGWRYAMTAPLTQQRIDAVRQSGLFAGHFNNGVASALPFAGDSVEVRVDGARHVVDRRALDWRDPEGHWELVALDNVSALMTWRDRWWVASLSFALVMLAGALLLRLRTLGEQLREVGQRHDVLRQALRESPMAAVLADADGRIVWVNARYEQDSGYALAALRGQKSSLLASGQIPPATYRDLWSTLMAGQRWEGSLVNRDRAGQLHEEWVQIAPVFDGRGQRIALVGWHQRRAAAPLALPGA